MTTVSMTVNGQTRSADVEDRLLLVDFIRRKLGLTGTHVGCDTTQCGACTVLLNGMAVKSCTVLTVAVSGDEIVTIEGVAQGKELNDVQKAFQEHHGLQCGFCTSGMVMAAIGMIERHQGALTASLVRDELDGNLCRCTGYHNIVAAILAAGEMFRAKAQESAQ